MTTTKTEPKAHVIIIDEELAKEARPISAKMFSLIILYGFVILGFRGWKQFFVYMTGIVLGFSTGAIGVLAHGNQAGKKKKITLP